jgi:23S rRNA (guanosine2251-2'-O)-methyltransferase
MAQKQNKSRFRSKPQKSADRIIYGLHSVGAAMGNPKRQINAIFATKNAAARLPQQVGRRHIAIHDASPKDLDHMCEPGAVHQGVVAKVAPLPAMAIEDIAPQGLVVILDQLTDPHNVGAILRSCAAFNVQAVVTQDRNSPQGSPILAKTASGAVEHVPIIEVTNLGRAMDKLKQLNFTLIGLDSQAGHCMDELTIPAPLALVLGAEGKGLRHKTRQNCDIMARLDMPGVIKSLNVSNAAAICLYSLHGKITLK